MNIRKGTKADAENIAHVHVKSWQTTYKGILPDTVLDNLSYMQRTMQWTQIMESGNVYVAEDSKGDIIGFSNGGRERTGKYPEFMGELYAIYILEAYQQKGVGRKLLWPVFEELEVNGMHSMLVWVIDGNPAENFYKAIGGIFLDKEDIEIGGNTYQEHAYGWNVLPKL